MCHIGQLHVIDVATVAREQALGPRHAPCSSRSTSGLSAAFRAGDSVGYEHSLAC
jgi:hypothetical protein